MKDQSSQRQMDWPKLQSTPPEQSLTNLIGYPDSSPSRMFYPAKTTGREGKARMQLKAQNTEKKPAGRISNKGSLLVNRSLAQMEPGTESSRGKPSFLDKKINKIMDTSALMSEHNKTALLNIDNNIKEKTKKYYQKHSKGGKVGSKKEPKADIYSSPGKGKKSGTSNKQGSNLAAKDSLLGSSQRSNYG